MVDNYGSYVSAHFRDHLRDDPEAMALTDGRVALSRAELAELAESVRNHAVLSGASRVAAVGTQSLPQAAALVACHLAGREFGVVDSSEDPDIVAAHVAALNPDAVIDFSGGVGGSRVPSVAAEALFADVAKSVDRCGGTSPYAYTVRTSGTTGRPKLVQLSRVALGQYVNEFTLRYDLGVGSRLAIWASPTYDAHHCQLFSAISSGAVGVVAEQAVRRTGSSVLAWLVANRITHFETTPTILRGLAAAMRSNRLPVDLIHIICSGERLDPSLAREIAKLSSRVRLSNEYGPTECVLATWHEITESDLELPDLPVGTAIPGREILVSPPPGSTTAASRAEPGEVVIRSPHLCAGYGLDGALNEVFPADESGVRTYRTGDFGYVDDRGLLRLTGRRDRTIKRRGAKIDLEDVERAFLAVPYITEAAARAETGAAAVWVWVSTDGTVRSIDDLRADVAPLLASASAPERILLVDALPRLHSGKIDYTALPGTGEDEAPDDGTPTTDTETVVAAEFARVLGVPSIKADADFFASGGHSLLALDLNRRISRRFDVDVTLADVLRHPRARALAALVDRRRVDTPTGNAARWVANLTVAERPIWTRSQLFPKDGSANVVAGFRTPLPVSDAVVAEGISRLVRNSAQLRLRYPTARAERVVYPPQPVNVQTVTVAGDVGNSRLPEVYRQLYRPFDIARDQLIRAVIVRSAAGPQTAVMLVVHHLICDGIGLSALLSSLYTLLASGIPAPISASPALPTAQPTAAAERHWQTVRARLKELPCTFALPPNPRSTMEAPPFPAISLDATMPVKNSRLSVVLVEYVAEALLQLTCSDAVVVETPVSLRGPQQDDIVGNFVIDVPIVVERVSPDGRPDRRDQVAADLLSAIDAAPAAPGFGGSRPGQGLGPVGDAVVVLEYPTTSGHVVPVHVPGSPPRNPVAVYVKVMDNSLKIQALSGADPTLARAVNKHFHRSWQPAKVQR